MRVLAIVFALLFVFASSSMAYDLSLSTIPVPTALQNAFYVEVKDESSKLPLGQIDFVSGIVGVTNLQVGNIQTVVVGNFKVLFNNIPSTKDTLNLNPYLNNSYLENQCQSAFIAMGQLPIVNLKSPRFKLLKWDSLSTEHQRKFIETYLQAYSDIWQEESEHVGMMQMPTGVGSSLKLRPPKGKEAFMALFRTDGGRVDYRLEENGTDFSIRDYYKNLTVVQYPWYRQILDNEMEIGLDNSDFNITSATYTYNFDSVTRSLRTNVSLEVSVSKSISSMQLYGAPQYNVNSAVLITSKGGVNLRINRNLDKNPDDWSLELAGSIPSGKHRIVISGEQTMPKDWATIGYDGSYRFDVSPLWPFYGKPVDVEIKLSLDHSTDWYYATSSDVTKSKVNKNEAEHLWKNVSRNRIVVASIHNPVSITNKGITLQVYAPMALRSQLESLDYIKAISFMLAYYQDQYGYRNITEQPVFILPEEQGVQAFENAGLIFILGSGQIGLPLIGHEIAHIWWGEGVSAPRWFQEGMANYSTTKFMESYAPEQGKEYRRYLMNFALSNILPVSIETRDKIDDIGAVYHNSAAIMFHLEHSLGTEEWHSILRQLYRRNSTKFFMTKNDLYSDLNSISYNKTAEILDKYCEKGEIAFTDEPDVEYKQFALNSGRVKYIQMWPWLVSVKRKQSIGDYQGALYCALQAAKHRSEPKDLVTIAQLRLLNNQVEIARNMALELAANSSMDPRSQLKLVYLLSEIARIEGDVASESQHLQRVAAEGMALGLMQEVGKAQKRLKELNSK